MAARVEWPSSRRRAKSAVGGPTSALELERRCGLRLRQVRGAEMVLGTYDVMRLADAEFGLRVSREIARQWLEICGAAAPSCELLRIESADELERRCGPFLRASGVVSGMTISDEKLVEVFLGFFPHVRAPAGVLRSWVRDLGEPDAVIPDLSRFRRQYKNRKCAPRLRSYEDLVSKCGPLLDHIFEATPCVSVRELADAMRTCHLDISEKRPPDFLYDYVALRKMGVHSLKLLHEVPVGEVASLSADLDLHCEGRAGAQRCAARRGVVLSDEAIHNFLRLAGKARVVAMAQVDLDGQLRGDLERLLAEHLVLHGVHRVCEELLARRRVCLPFEELRARLLRSRFRDLGRLPAELCWRVMFAYVERGRNYLAYGPYSE